MSILLFGLRGPLPTQDNTAGTSIRALVLRNLKTTLESIRGLTDPVGGTSNASYGVTAAAGGAYAGTVTRRYKVHVTTAGASGAAKVTVTDDTPADQQALWPSGTVTDDGPAGETVTSGTAFDLGSLGATCTLTFGGSLVADDVWHVWVGTYATSALEVTRLEDARPTTHHLIIQGFPDGEPIDGPLTLESELLTITLTLRARPGPDSPEDLEALLADVRKAVMVDITRGGYALWTRIDVNVGLALQEIKAFSECQLQVTILYRTDESDPSSL